MREAFRLAFLHMRLRAFRCAGVAAACAVGVLGFGVMISLAIGMGAYADDLQKRLLTSVPLTLTQQRLSVPDINAEQGDAAADGLVHNDGSLALAIGNEEAGKDDYPLYQLAPLLDIWASDNEDVISVQSFYSLSDDLYVETKEGWRRAIPDGLFSQANIGDDSLFRSLLSNDSDVLTDRYALRCGRMPQSADEVVIVTQPNGNLSDAFLSAVGVVEISQLTPNSSGQGKIDIPLDTLMGLNLKVLEGWGYQVWEGQRWHDARDEPQYLQAALASAIPVHIVGIVTPRYMLRDVYDTGFVGYLPDFNAYAMQCAASSAPVEAQEASPLVDVWTQRAFDSHELASLLCANVDGQLFDERKVEYLSSLSDTRVLALLEALGISEEELLTKGADAFDQQELADVEALSYNEFVRMVDRLAPTSLDDGYAQRMRHLDFPSVEDVYSIRIYTDTLEARQEAKELIANFNASQHDIGGVLIDVQPAPELDMFDQATRVMRLVLLVLGIISLVVIIAVIASTMFTFAAERMREVGCLRSLGMSRMQVTIMFIFEALCIACAAALIGAAIAGLVVGGLDILVANITGIHGLFVFGPSVFFLIVVSSLGIACVAAVVPALRAALMDPVRALSNSDV